MRWMESQIETRERLNAQMTERAYGELALSVTRKANAVPSVSVDNATQADSAVRACLKYLGVKAGDVPEGITDYEERIEWQCRPSGTMRRTVRLDPGWQNTSFGAMIGKLKTGETVALLPRGASAEGMPPAFFISLQQYSMIFDKRGIFIYGFMLSFMLSCRK